MDRKTLVHQVLDRTWEVIPEQLDYADDDAMLSIDVHTVGLESSYQSIKNGFKYGE